MLLLGTRISNQARPDAVEARQVCRMVRVQRIELLGEQKRLFRLTQLLRALIWVGQIAGTLEIRTPQKEGVEILGRLKRKSALVSVGTTVPYTGIVKIGPRFV